MLALYGQPPRPNQPDNTSKSAAYLAQSNEKGLLPQPTNKSQELNSIILTRKDYKEYLQFQTAKQHPLSSSIAHSCNSFACLTKCSPNCFGNHNLFSTLVSPSTPFKVTLANDSQTQVKGIGKVQFLPSISLTTILFSPECPYILISISKLTKNLNYSVTFTTDSIVVQDRVLREYLEQDLSHKDCTTSPVAFVSTTSAELIHNHLGHPSLLKLQKIVPSLSSLSSLACESCQLGK
ncbi:hypothetical protein MANES_05G202440v8 [Manihot esculenta]|uniref:Uncharacterized protein n=1 Tax=Manihot esculenta TaxID=3983 RepID=A0ACB7HTJ4_MANES|nr:hypothetical protein MANES_05G202440v8 [Manihot esculenta]